MSRDEHQTRIELINPALFLRGWGDSLIREEKTPGGTDIINGRPRKRSGRTDYLLCVLVVKGKPPLPLAIVEAKAEDKLPSLGIQQAKDYMKKFNVPFIFSTNGKLFAEYGDDTGQIKDAMSLSNFPTPEDLRQRYEKSNGFKLDSEAAKPLLMPYKGGEAVRYYFQDAAIRAALEKIAIGEKKVLLSLATGQEDGYLAACEVIRRTVDLDKKEITKEDIERRSAIDPYTGKKVNPEEIEDRYNAKDYEVKLMLDDRVKAMTEDLFQFLLDTGGPYQKTIIFCARDIHANQIMIAMNNLYEKWCKENRQKPREWYAFQCTGNPDLRPSADKIIPDFRGSKNSHYIAATVDLLSTGVDIPNLGNVVFFRYLESPISFYQMSPTPPYGDDKPKRKIIRVGEQQFTVQIEGEGRSILWNLAERLVDEAPGVEELREKWVELNERHKLISKLPGGEGAVRLIRELEDERECDLFDVLAKLGYKIPPKSRGERVAAFSYKNKQWLRQFPERTGNVLVSIARQFEKGGIEELETRYLFDQAEVVASGGFKALVGQKVPPEILIQETKTRLLT